MQCYAGSLGMYSGQLCMACPNTAEFRCQDFSSIAFYCSDCCRSHHRHNHIFHFPERWVDGRFVLAPLTNVIVPLTHECATAYCQKVTVVSARGEFQILVCGTCIVIVTMHFF